MSNYTGHHIRRACLLLKILRRKDWMTRAELDAAMGVPESADRLKMLSILEDEGLLEARLRPGKRTCGGKPPREFRISPAWRDE